MHSAPWELVSYCFWKWADNGLPGRPTEVQAALLQGELPPTLQAFDARPLLQKLTAAAARGREAGEEWDWQVFPAGQVDRAHFVRVVCPRFNDSRERIEWFWDEFLPLNLSGLDEEYGHLIPCLRPKLTQLIPLQCPGETHYDIAEEDLPDLLRWMLLDFSRATVELLDRHRGVVAIAKGRRYRVEWRECPDWTRPAEFSQWKVSDLQRTARPMRPRGNASAVQKSAGLLCFTDTLRIFQTFLRGQSRPQEYVWSDCTASMM